MTAPTSDDAANSNVIRLVDDPETTDGVLMEAMERGLTSALILGYTPEGTLYIRSSPDVTRKEALWMLENARACVLGNDE